MSEELKKMSPVVLEQAEKSKPEMDEKQELAKVKTDYFKITEIVMDATKKANPSVMDHLGIYRGPVFVALVAYFFLHMVRWDLTADFVGMGLIVLCVVHKLLHMGQVKESLNAFIDNGVETAKDKMKRKKVEAKEEPKKDETKKEEVK